MKYLVLLLLIGFIFTLYCIKGRTTKIEILRHFSEWDFAHRGLHNDILPENTLVAYQNAIKHGYGFEFDVQRTKDDVLVVMHDRSLLRACGVEKNIDECSYEEIRNLTVFNSAERIPLFTEVLEMVNDQVPLIIEIKQHTNDTRVCELVAEILDKYHGEFCVESFHVLAVKWFKENRPEWVRGQLSTDYSSSKKLAPIMRFLLENLISNYLTRPDFVAYSVDYRDKHPGLKIYRDLLKGFTVYWTVRDLRTYHQCNKKDTIQIFENFIPEEK